MLLVILFRVNHFVNLSIFEKLEEKNENGVFHLVHIADDVCV